MSPADRRPQWGEIRIVRTGVQRPVKPIRGVEIGGWNGVDGNGGKLLERFLGMVRRHVQERAQVLAGRIADGPGAQQ